MSPPLQSSTATAKTIDTNDRDAGDSVRWDAYLGGYCATKCHPAIRNYFFPCGQMLCLCTYLSYLSTVCSGWNHNLALCWILYGSMVLKMVQRYMFYPDVSHWSFVGPDTYLIILRPQTANTNCIEPELAANWAMLIWAIYFFRNQWINFDQPQRFPFGQYFFERTKIVCGTLFLHFDRQILPIFSQAWLFSR